MNKLRAIFESLGFADVETFIASGNVIFRARSARPESLERKIETALGKSLGFEVATIVRSASDLSGIVGLEPFPGPAGPTATLYVGLLRSAPNDVARQRVLAMHTPTDDFRVEGRELYWLCHTGSMDSVVSMARLEKAVAMPATFRNISTLRKLADKYCE